MRRVMASKIYQGIVKSGAIHLEPNVKLPESTKVYILVPDSKPEGKRVIHFVSPRLVHREDAAQFRMTVTEEKPRLRR